MPARHRYIKMQYIFTSAHLSVQGNRRVIASISLDKNDVR